MHHKLFKKRLCKVLLSNDVLNNLDDKYFRSFKIQSMCDEFFFSVREVEINFICLEQTHEKITTN